MSPYLGAYDVRREKNGIYLLGKGFDGTNLRRLWRHALVAGGASALVLQRGYVGNSSRNEVKADSTPLHLCPSHLFRASALSLEAPASHAASVLNPFSTHLKSPPAVYWTMENRVSCGLTGVL
jgi:hypothetical protein